MKRLIVFILLVICANNISAQDPGILEIINKVSLDSLVKHVRILSGEDPWTTGDSTYIISNRTYNQPGNEIASEYLKTKLEKYIGSSEFMPYSETGKNVIGVKLGTENPSELYVISAHYDAVANYCADDNVSSCAAILEAARILANVDTKSSIIFAFWDEEEIGLVGSRYAVQWVEANSMNIDAVLNIEMLGWDSDDDGLFDIHVRDIANTLQLGDLIYNMIEQYNLDLIPNMINPGTDRSDHASFWAEGYTATVFGEAFFSGDANPNYHTDQDRIDKFNMNYFHELSKLVAGSIAQLAIHGLTEFVSVKNNALEHKFSLEQNYPNPFNPSTKIVYEIPKTSNVSLKVYDMLGREVKQLVNAKQAAGSYEINFNATGLSNGVYLYKLNVGEFREAKKMILLK